MNRPNSQLHVPDLLSEEEKMNMKKELKRTRIKFSFRLFISFKNQNINVNKADLTYFQKFTDVSAISNLFSTSLKNTF